MLTVVTIQRLGPEATREEADRLVARLGTWEPPGTITASVVEGEPVILAGLVKGGEIRTREDFSNRALRGPWVPFAAADGRAVEDSVRGFEAAEARGALPITWYTHEEG